ncbi:four-domain proteases inhibitor-like [Mizuhopecten yessoensis]|uniref:Agrin n=1 Tax=Mizuhopecten yessoensis TaxID=6573 RepID=A0A210PDH4_MIZYE|nr:four-domain proteases inhibitor-like [Mizuhopecten yessoensis]OWF34524.1 Agrin [Mizuhopecten yessoensis]
MYTLAVFVTVLGAVYGQSHLCDRICNSQYSPVCGTDRHTYSNMCKLQIAECYARLKGQHMTLAHTGSCRSTSTQPHSTHCDTICDDESGDSAVCGSDGITYGNIMFLTWHKGYLSFNRDIDLVTFMEPV